MLNVINVQCQLCVCVCVYAWAVVCVHVLTGGVSIRASEGICLLELNAGTIGIFGADCQGCHIMYTEIKYMSHNEA